MSGPFGAGALNLFSGVKKFYPHELDQSLRFNDDDSAYLSRTPSSDGNLKKWVWSGWVKKNTHFQTGGDYIFYAGDASSNDTALYWYGGTGSVADQLVFEIYAGGTSYNIRTDARFRDGSAWYHIVAMLDTTQATSSNRMKLYVNGEEITSFAASSYPTENLDSMVNDASFEHFLGRRGSSYADIYMAEVHLVDGLSFFSDTSGTANSSFNINSFGETKEGIWIPKRYSDSHGTNGFHLTFEDDTTVEGFNTVLFDGTGATKSISGVGFQPDLVWVKVRDGTTNHQWTDSVRGINKNLITNGTNPEDTTSTNKLTSFDSDGFTLGGNPSTNASGKDYVAWCWDAGTGSASSNSNGTITSSVKANAARGFSIVTYTGNGTNGTVGHGLSAAPTWIMVKNRGDTENWAVWHTGIPITKFLRLNDTPIATTPTNARWNDTAPTSTVFSVGDTSTGDNEVNANGDNYVAYCWTNVSGYSAMGTYAGTGSSNKITTGFKPAFILVKSYDQTRNWIVWDNTRTATNPADGHIHPNSSTNEQTGTDTIQFDSDGFTLLTNDSDSNQNTFNYIYVAFADTRESAFWTDHSGNNNDFQHHNLEHIDVVPDRPTNNFATFNPLLFTTTPTLQEGNLEASLTSGSGQANRSRLGSTFHITSGKWYWELTVSGAGDYVGFGISRSGFRYMLHTDPSEGVGFASFQTQATAAVTFTAKDGTGSTATTATGPSITNIVQIALDADAGKMWVGNGTNFYSGDGTGNITGTSGDPVAGTNAPFTGLDFTKPWTPIIEMTGANESETFIINFGQDSSFNGSEVSQGNADQSGHGDFYFSPPTGYLALCTDNLPDPGIDPNADENPADYFNTVTYPGAGGTQAITGVGFQPDWVWAKARNVAFNHRLYDVVRGVSKRLDTSSSGPEGTENGVTSFDSDGFTAAHAGTNNSGNTFVAWNWKAGGTAVTNTDGTVDSLVSASPESGFSIVSYTATGSGDITVGHGLGVAPEFIMGKVRNQAYGWVNFALPAGADAVVGFGTNAASSGSDNVAYGKTAPTSTVFTAGRGGVDNMNFGSGDQVIAYCFAPIQGYSAIGSFIGNGSASGPFIFTGFRPAWILFKRIDGGTHHWRLFDSVRNTFNEVDEYLTPSSGGTEATGKDIDLLSNGFRIITTDTDTDTTGGKILYIALAEQPFKYANAR